ncbi:uncharacterized protein BcabD6B2_24610 [Babesia caballi]|uniref:Uncharacterized protein n=1 Tax=Babesia caballi TaxID=5871 RepID=A0AAV4LV97_BABCB|nr:hypothetical protein BcabD6B2_24610 [Babesia caballi]
MVEAVAGGVGVAQKSAAESASAAVAERRALLERDVHVAARAKLLLHRAGPEDLAAEARLGIPPGVVVADDNGYVVAPGYVAQGDAEPQHVAPALQGLQEAEGPQGVHDQGGNGARADAFEARQVAVAGQALGEVGDDLFELLAVEDAQEDEAVAVEHARQGHRARRVHVQGQAGRAVGEGEAVGGLTAAAGAGDLGDAGPGEKVAESAPGALSCADCARLGAPLEQGLERVAELRAPWAGGRGA